MIYLKRNEISNFFSLEKLYWRENSHALPGFDTHNTKTDGKCEQVN